MKKHSSVLMLLVRSSVYRIVLLFAMMTAAEVGLFWLVLQNSQTESVHGLELAISYCRLPVVFAAAFFALTGLLCSTGSEGKTKTGYTLRRLGISETTVFFWQAGYNALCYLLLWMVQILVCMLLGLLYTRWIPQEFVTGQTMFLAFYRSEFFHSLLPFEENALWFRNAILVLSLGICSARYPLGQRHGSKLHEIFGLATAAGVLFVADINDASGVLLILACMVAVGVSLFRAFDKEASYEEG